MLKKILTFVVFGIGVLVVGGIGYIYITDNRPSDTKKTGTTVAMTDQKTVKTNERLRKTPTRSVVKKDQTAVPAMPVIKQVLPDKEIEKPRKVAKEEIPITPPGVIAKPEFCHIIDVPKIIKKSINCFNGFIDLTECGLIGVEIDLVVTESESGEKYFFVCDEKGEEVKFRYAASVGDMNGSQHKQTIKLFAVGITRGEPSSYVILECPNAPVGDCLFSPVVADLKSPESTRRVLAELFYLDPANIDLLIPPPSVASYSKK